MSETEVVYVGVWRRLLASFIDNITWLIFYSWFLAGLVAAVYEESPEAGAIILLVFLSAWFNYFLFCEWRWGQTIGKNATGIEVRSLDGSDRISFGQASIRNLLRIVDFLAVGWIMVATGRRKQRLGDKAAKTVVVRRPPKTVPALRGAADPRAGVPAPKPPATEPQPPGPSAPRAGPGIGLGGFADLPWGPKDAAWGLVGGLILAVLIAPLLVLPFDPDLDSTGALLAAQGLLGASLLFVSIGMASQWRFRRLRLALSRLGLRNFRFSGLGIGLLTLFAYYIAVAIFATFVLEPQQEDIGSELGIGGESVLVAVVAVLLIVGLAPIAEELFFRGFLFAGLRSRWPLWAAALLSGVIFGLIHAPTGLTAVVPLSALGVVLCWLYERTGSLWPCVMVHLINNSLALAVAS